VGSSYEVYITRNPIVQSDFKFDGMFRMYSFFNSKQLCMWMVIFIWSLFACMQRNKAASN
jgi:hypothetical protein